MRIQEQIDEQRLDRCRVMAKAMGAVGLATFRDRPVV
jgi:hypothetical protein